MIFWPCSTDALMPVQRSRLLALTLPPRHPGDESIFTQILKAPEARAHHVTSLALVCISGSAWIGWTLFWWRPSESVARVGVFVTPEHRCVGVGGQLLRRTKLAAEALGLRLRGNATSDIAARLFERLDIENDARPRPMCPCGVPAVAGYSERNPRCAKCWTEEALDQPG